MTEEQKIKEFWDKAKSAPLQSYTSDITFDHVELMYQAFKHRLIREMKQEAAIDIFPDSKGDSNG